MTQRGNVFTLDEVAKFVQDALRAGAAGNETVYVVATMRGKISRLTVNVEA
jgi:tRNA(Ser,Leu) C12 N-acetylase TAN1